MSRVNMKEAAAILGPSQRSMSRWRKEGMPCYPTVRGKPVEVELDEVQAWMQANGKQERAPLRLVQARTAALDAAAPEPDPPLPEGSPQRVAHACAWRAAAAAMKCVSDLIKEGALKPSPQQAKSLVDAALALDKRLGFVEEVQDEFSALTIDELQEKLNETRASQFGGKVA